MKGLAILTTFAFVFAVASPALAQETVEVKPAPVEKKVVPVLAGKIAPFTGLLVPEARFKELLKAELAVFELRGKLDIREREAHNIEELYRKRLEEATAPPPWYESGGFNRWLGFGIGAGLTILALYAGSQVQR